MSEILPGERLIDEEMRQIVDTFRTDGYVHVPGVLTTGEVETLKARTEVFFADHKLAERYNPDLADHRYIQTKLDNKGEVRPFILRNTIELDALYRDILVREPILSLAEAIVGKDCVFCGQNVLRNLPGMAIDDWHVDGEVHFSVPDDVPRHHEDTPPPTLWITVQMALTDTEAIEFGPTQYVPGSHFSGHNPNSQKNPEFEGRGPETVFCKAGDIYIQDPQCWHRGAPNLSSRTRYLIQSQYARRWAWWRFSLCNGVPVADDDLEQSSERLLRLLARSRPSDRVTDTYQSS